MKRRINSILLVMFALLTSQGILAQGSQEVIFEESFSKDLGGFTTEGYGIWHYYESQKCLQMMCKNNMETTPPYETSYLVSPEIKAGTGNTITFEHGASFDWYNSLMTKAAVYVRTIGGEWTKIEGVPSPSDSFSGSFSSTGEIAVPADFENQSIQIAFGYTPVSSADETAWFIKNFVFKGIPGSTEPEISEKILFDKSGDELFNATYSGFSIEGYQGLDSWQTVWNFNTWGGPFGINTGFINVGDTDIESYLVTPVIRMHVNNKIEIGHTVIGYAAGEAEKHLALCIREEGATEWDVVEGVTFGEDNVETYTDFLSIDPKYNDKKVQFGFKYTAEDAYKAGTWYLSSIMVVGDAPDPVEAGISYDVTEYKYEIGSKDPFKTPVINNPNGLAVRYETSDWDIATVDSNTGEVTIGGNKQGTVTITARTEECVEFLAGEASYTIEVVDPILIFKAPFTNDECGFTEEGGSVWKFNYGNVAAQNPVDAPTTSYYVSPEIELSADGNLVSFYHAAQGIPNISEHAGLCIRTIGGEWQEIAIEKWPAEGTFWWDLISTGDINVPAEFNGKTVQFGFRFTLDETTFAENVGNDWPNTKYVINNFIVTKYIERAEAGLSFDQTEITYELGEIPFKAPVLNNPNELQVSYAVDMNGGSDVVSVNAITGEVTILDTGVATIYARSTKNNEFKAGEASYTLTVTDPNLVFRAKFGKSGLCDFTEEGATGYWSFDGYVNTGACTNANDAEGTKGYLVSPEFTLGESDNFASWKENGYNLDFANQALFAVREVGGEWVEISDIDRSGENYGGMLQVEGVKIPSEFNGKNVQVAFIFVNGDPNNWQSWNINDLKIRKTPVKVDPEIAFDKETATYIKGEEFVAPVLSNPNNVAVTYSSSEVAVATVNELTGELEFIGEGETVITATSEETNKYLSATASYTLSVLFVPVGIDNVESISLKNAKIYDLQGNRIQNIVKGGIYIINGKKVIIR